MSEGPSDLTSLVQALNRLSIAIEAGNRNHSQSEEWEVISGEDPPPEGPARPQESALGSVAYNDYEGFAELLPPCPERYIGLCSRLKGGGYSSVYRAKRAWEAGYWASLCWKGRIKVPRATLPFDLKPAVYIIVRSPGLESPTRVSRASDLARITGRFSESTICHGFASLAEAETYCAGLGIELPCQYQFQ